MTLNLSLDPAAEARLRALAEKAGTDVSAYVSQLVEIATDQGRSASENDSELHTNRPIGLAKGGFKIPASFFDPLPDDLVEAFDGTAR